MNKINDEIFSKLEKSTGKFLPPELKKKLSEKIDDMRNYTPAVGVFGKTGVGKSSLCNAIFGEDVCAISDVEACTRNPQEVILNLGGGGLKLLDVPGVGESGERDKEYDELYQSLLPKLDLILWVFKGDDRASASDEYFYKRIIRRYVDAGKPFLAVINQIEKIEPFKEWSEEERKPGPKQLTNIEKKRSQIAGLLDIPMSKVVAISANERYGLVELVDSIVHELPNEKKMVVLEKIKAAEDAEIAKFQAEAAKAQAAAEAQRVALEKLKEENIAIARKAKEVEDGMAIEAKRLALEALKEKNRNEERLAELQALERRAKEAAAERERNSNVSRKAEGEANEGLWETVKSVASSIWSAVKFW